MDWIFRPLRSKVSGDKKRFVEGDLDLDLTYITPRIIAMAFPASGLEGAYRNDIDKVSIMLEKYHPDHYMIYNLTERDYNVQKFGGNVRHMGWMDHHAPPLALMFEIMRDIHQFLLRDPDNVVDIHCLAGKGRTGSIITCYMCYAGMFDNIQQAGLYFATMRSYNNWGVTGPSQQRYLNYFADVLYSKKIPKSDPLRLVGISFQCIPKFSNGPGRACFTPMFQIVDVSGGVTKRVIYTSKPTKTYDYTDDTDFKVAVGFEEKVILLGDINITVSHINSFGCVKVARFAFHTGMLPEDGILRLTKPEIDDACNDARFPSKFCIELIFEKAKPKWYANTTFLQTAKQDFWEKVLDEYVDHHAMTCFLHTDDIEQCTRDAKELICDFGGAATVLGGWLTKRGHIMKNWKRRWFTLNATTLEYYKGPKQQTACGVIQLDSILAVTEISSHPDCDKPYQFMIYTALKDFHCYAANEKEMEDWIEALNTVLSRNILNQNVDKITIGQLNVQITDALGLPQANNDSYFMIALGPTRFRVDPQSAKEVTFHLPKGNTTPLLVQLWLDNGILPDEIRGEIQLNLSGLDGNSDKLLSYSDRYIFSTVSSAIISLFFIPKTHMVSQLSERKQKLNESRSAQRQKEYVETTGKDVESPIQRSTSPNPEESSKEDVKPKEEGDQPNKVQVTEPNNETFSQPTTKLKRYTSLLGGGMHGGPVAKPRSVQYKDRLRKKELEEKGDQVEGLPQLTPREDTEEKTPRELPETSESLQPPQQQNLEPSDK